jgi:hypothetical protein
MSTDGRTVAEATCTTRRAIAAERGIVLDIVEFLRGLMRLLLPLCFREDRKFEVYIGGLGYVYTVAFSRQADSSGDRQAHNKIFTSMCFSSPSIPLLLCYY